jgi:uncharacterized protein involved in response to NO
MLFSGVWWALVQLDRLGLGLGLAYSMSPTLTHSTVMTLGFMPLLFVGFLFTAGPKWLGVRSLHATQLLTPLALQVVGWVLWTVGGHAGALVALTGAVLAWSGLVWVQLLFLRLLSQSQVPDRMHVQLIVGAGAVGIVSMGGLLICLLRNAPDLARLWLLTALWGYVVATFVVVAHRMLPFFTASAIPGQQIWRPGWLMLLLLSVIGIEVLLPWLEWWGTGRDAGSHAWMLTRGLLELAMGSVLVWLAFVWGLVKSMRIRLLAMLHIGFVWLGLAIVLAGLSQLLGFRSGVPFLGLGPLHALTMGFLGSITLAMVTRVSSGHSGRPLQVDNLVWVAFWALQVAVVLRVAAPLSVSAGWVLLWAALLWLFATLAWGLPMLGWYVRPRADGQAG